MVVDPVYTVLIAQLSESDRHLINKLSLGFGDRNLTG